MPPAKQPGTPREVAEYLQKSEKTLANWRSLGIGPPYIKPAGTIRYRWSDVEKWLTSNAVTPQASHAAAG